MTIRSVPGGCSIAVHLQPRAAAAAVVGAHGHALKVRVTAPPVSGRANAALLRLLADSLGVAPTAVALAAGPHGRAKVVTVAGVTPDEARARLRRAVLAPAAP